MKRGKKFLLYISSMAFCCLMMLFIGNIEVDASSAFTCIDKETGNECNDDSSEIYYRLDKIEVDSNISVLELPSTYNDVNVEEIASNVIESSESLNLQSLVLPTNLEKINDNAFSNIESLEKMIIPTNVNYIGKYIFKNGARVSEIYLNHYQLSDLDIKMNIDVEAFLGIDISRIVVDNFDVFIYYTTDERSTLKDLPVVSKVTYKYYAYQNVELTDLNCEKSYYIGKNQVIDSIPEDLELKGLKFLGWYIRIGEGDSKIKLNDTTYYENYKREYNVYPKFELNPLQFEISSKNSENKDVINARYNGKEDLITLSVINVKHDLIEDNLFKVESLTWNKVVADTTDLFSNDETISLNKVSDSGRYECILTYKYVYNGYNYYVSSKGVKEISITRAPLYVVVENITKTFGNYLTDDDVKYTIQGLLNNDKEDKISYSYINKETYIDPDTGKHSAIIPAKFYEDTIRVKVESITDGVSSKMHNYDILYSYGDYLVTPKVVEVYYDDNISFVYGEEIVIKKLKVDNEPYNQGQFMNIHFNKEPGLNVGTYKITGVKSIDNPNYIANYNSEKSTGTITITPLKVESVVEVDNNTYDGNDKKLEVYYQAINGMKVDLDYSLTYKGNAISSVKNAGSYIVNIGNMNNDNYAFVDSNQTIKIITIAKAKTQPVPGKDYDQSQRFVYTGSRINPNIHIANDEQSPVFTCVLASTIGDYCKNAGSYSVNVWYPESDNYEEVNVIDISIYIEKFSINLTPKSFRFYYGEEIEIKEEIVINGEKVIAEYSSVDGVGNSLMSYPILGVTLKNAVTGANHNNYAASLLSSECEHKITIIPRPVTIVFYNYENLIYDGKEKNIGVYAVDNISQKVVTDLKFEVISDEGIIKDAKTYHLHAYFDNEYYRAVNSNALVISISKAKHDMSNIRFDDASFILNFKEHSISINGKLPEGVKVEYSINGKEGNSAVFANSKKVVAKFIVDELNYFPIENMEATISVNITWFVISIISFILFASIIAASIILYAIYRRAHPKKIKLKIKTVVEEDLAAKRVATSVKEVLGDKDKTEEIIEDENDLIVDSSKEDGFIERIYTASSELKYYYSEVKNELLSYEGITHTIDRKYEVFYHGTRQIAKLSICNNILRLYVNLDPSKYDVKSYNHSDMSDFSCHARTPLRINVNTTESLRHARVFVRILRKKENLKAVSSFVKIDYEKFYTLKENVFPRLFKKMFVPKNKKKGK